MGRAVQIQGWGQRTQGKEWAGELLDPLGLMVEASKRAATVTGRAGILRDLDGVMVVRVMSRHCPSAADKLARALGASPRLTMVSGIGGSSPQALVNRAASMISRGELDTVLIAGGETYYPRGKDRSGSEGALFRGFAGRERDDMVGSTELEARHGVVLPIHGFPLFETALWAESGEDIETHRRGIARRWNDLSRIAAEHPNAWTKKVRSVEEIATVTPENRMICFPYLKLMNPLVSVDLGAAVIVTAGEAGGHGRPVFVLSGAFGEDRQRFPLWRTDFTSSAPLGEAARRALSRARLELDEVDCFDLYSCFPCALAIARREIGLGADDPRPLSLTGGLGFFGGPGNNYSLHAIATLAEAIASGRHETGLVTGLGWFLHKHSVGIYGSQPGHTTADTFGLEDDTHPPVGDEPVEVVERPAGRGRIETYTVLHSREGEPKGAIIYGKTDEELRFVARTPATRETFEALTTQCQVGRPVRLWHEAGRGLNMAEIL